MNLRLVLCCTQHCLCFLCCTQHCLCFCFLRCCHDCNSDRCVYFYCGCCSFNCYSSDSIIPGHIPSYPAIAANATSSTYSTFSASSLDGSTTLTGSSGCICNCTSLVGGTVSWGWK